ncbi:MAG TPA: GvpL/GvpF family gas vesicle protein [Nocardioidaceae bacterium]|nr:GvpL/GvpF family gas vesicle protein [Nocardioidaceae bacterium]
MNADACYTYAVARPFDVATIGPVRGVDDAAIRLFRYRDIVAVSSAMPPEAAEEGALRTRLETLESMEAMARAHHAVVEAVVERAVAIPFRLATIHHDERRVIGMLRHGHAEFDATLNRLAGRVEMGVKVYANISAPPPTSIVASVSDSPGRDYLRTRRVERNQRERGSRQAVDVAERVDAALAESAVERALHRPQAARLHIDRAENVLNAAYLVEARDLPAFHTLVRRLGSDAPGVRIEVTGPWPAYSFASLDSGGEP